jgi:CheY-like chemotaxis protein
MATVLVAGANDALIEGIVQALAAAGHRVGTARSPLEAAEALALSPPLVLLAERTVMPEDALAPHVPNGTAVVLFRGQEERIAASPRQWRRHTLADLELPLERQRLLLLIQAIERRARETGRRREEPPESLLA